MPTPSRSTALPLCTPRGQCHCLDLCVPAIVRGFVPSVGTKCYMMHGLNLNEGLVRCGGREHVHAAIRSSRRMAPRPPPPCVSRDAIVREQLFGLVPVVRRRPAFAAVVRLLRGGGSQADEIIIPRPPQWTEAVVRLQGRWRGMYGDGVGDGRRPPVAARPLPPPCRWSGYLTLWTLVWIAINSSDLKQGYYVKLWPYIFTKLPILNRGY